MSGRAWGGRAANAARRGAPRTKSGIEDDHASRSPRAHKPLFKARRLLLASTPTLIASTSTARREHASSTVCTHRCFSAYTTRDPTRQTASTRRGSHEHPLSTDVHTSILPRVHNVRLDSANRFNASREPLQRVTPTASTRRAGRFHHEHPLSTVCTHRWCRVYTMLDPARRQPRSLRRCVVTHGERPAAASASAPSSRAVRRSRREAAIAIAAARRGCWSVGTSW